MEKLDKDLQARLQKIEDEWNKKDYKFWSGKMCFYDLRVMLEHFQPLQQLIREIVTEQSTSNEVKLTQAAAVTETQPIQASKVDTGQAERIAALEAELAKLSKALTEANENLAAEQASLHATQQQLAGSQEQSQHYQQQSNQLAADLKQAEQLLLQAQTHSNQLELQLKNAVTNTERLNKQVSSLEAELKHSQINLPVLEFLRQETVVAQRLGLADLSSNTLQAVIRVIAVLSQRDSLERLWDVLKERCEDSNRALSSDEFALFNSALEWHNHNWSTRPFQLLMPAVNSSYDFEKQQKSTHTHSGETIAELRLPGIADGAGKVIRKSIVATC